MAPIGFSRTAAGVKAVVYGPQDRLWVLAPGAELYEARVESVDATGVTFTAKDGRKTVTPYGP